MTTHSRSDPAIAAVGPPNHSPARDWFLRDSKWDDERWVFAPTNLLEEETPLQIQWNFILPSGRRFTDPQYASLRETTKRLIATIRSSFVVHRSPPARTHGSRTFRASAAAPSLDGSGRIRTLFRARHRGGLKIPAHDSVSVGATAAPISSPSR